MHKIDKKYLWWTHPASGIFLVLLAMAGFTLHGYLSIYQAADVFKWFIGTFAAWLILARFYSFSNIKDAFKFPNCGATVVVFVGAMIFLLLATTLEVGIGVASL